MHSKELQKLINSKFDDEILNQIVSAKTGWKEFVIKKIILGKQAKKGDNYLSNIVRFTIDVDCKEDRLNAN